MSKEVLQSETVKELRERAKGLEIAGRWDMTKQELIAAILGAEKSGKSAGENESAKSNIKIGNQVDVEVEGKAEKKSTNIIPNLEEKKAYVDNAVIGTLVAFKMSNGKVKSAKIVKKSTPKRRFMLETVYGAQYVVPYEDIIWVRTGKRWPKGVYELLKGSASVE